MVSFALLKKQCTVFGPYLGKKQDMVRIPLARRAEILLTLLCTAAVSKEYGQQSP